MAEICLSFEQIEDLFREVLLIIFKLLRRDKNSVRFPYGSTTNPGSSPGIERGKNVCFVYIAPSDDGYGQQHHISYIPTEGKDKLTHVDEHTQIYTVTFSCYGPAAHDWARKIPVGLYRDDIRRLLKRNHFFVKTGITPPVPLNELRGGEWWRRFDVSATFYSYVRIEIPNLMGTIEHVNITFAPTHRAKEGDV